MNPAVTELTEEDPLKLCAFCSRTEINSVEWGPMYQLDDLVLHYFCMLFSSGLVQAGEDNEGVLGFLPKDIKKEVARGKKLKCKFCRKGHATVGCVVSKCKCSFHYPCGLQNGTLHQFQGHFASYCASHKPRQVIPRGVEWVCPICIGEVNNNDVGGGTAVWPPCCGKAVFHRRCIMHAAKEAGYFFKCPLCNSTDKFLEAVKANGVYVPEQDAAWETVPGAYAELTELYSNCDAPECLCPNGRKQDGGDKSWKIIRCGGCGSSAIHSKCGKLSSSSWKCDTCEGVLAKIGTGTIGSVPAVTTNGNHVNQEMESDSSDDNSSSSNDDISSSSNDDNDKELAATSSSSEESSEDSSNDEEEDDEERGSSGSDSDDSISHHERNIKRTIQSASQVLDQNSEDEETVPGEDRSIVYNLKFGKTYTVQDCNSDVNGRETISSPPKRKQKVNRAHILSSVQRIRNPHLHTRLGVMKAAAAAAELRRLEQSEISQNCIRKILEEGGKKLINIDSFPRIPKLKNRVESESDPVTTQLENGEKETEISVSTEEPPLPTARRLFREDYTLPANTSISLRSNLSESESVVSINSNSSNSGASSSSSIVTPPSSVTSLSISSSSSSTAPSSSSSSSSSSSTSTMTSSSSSGSSSIIESLRSKSLVKKVRNFKKPNKTRHKKVADSPESTARSTRSRSKPALPVFELSSGSDEDCTPENKKYESIPESSAFLSLVAGRKNHILEEVETRRLRRRWNRNLNEGVIDLSKDDDSDVEMIEVEKIGIGLTTNGIIGIFKTTSKDYWANCLEESENRDETLKSLYNSLNADKNKPHIEVQLD